MTDMGDVGERITTIEIDEPLSYGDIVEAVVELRDAGHEPGELRIRPDPLGCLLQASRSESANGNSRVRASSKDTARGPAPRHVDEGNRLETLAEQCCTVAIPGTSSSPDGETDLSGYSESTASAGQDDEDDPVIGTAMGIDVVEYDFLSADGPAVLVGADVGGRVELVTGAYY